jgi:hypothetical protein
MSRGDLRKDGQLPVKKKERKDAKPQAAPEGEFDDGEGEDLRAPPASPTSALPGSEEKILVYQARAALGVNLDHPGDCGSRTVKDRLEAMAKALSGGGGQP